jgi:hypothetical protein
MFSLVNPTPSIPLAALILVCDSGYYDDDKKIKKI